MAKPRAYVETTIVSYLTAWQSRDAAVADRQQVTREWWATAGDRFDLFTSELAMREAQRGDPAMAKARLDALATIPKVVVTEAAFALAGDFVRMGALPEKARPDAVHIAVAVTNTMDYLVTWNCKHLANAAIRRKVGECCRLAGFRPVTICTPEELGDQP